MGHDHSHHHHGHSHEVQAKDLNGAFIIGIVLNALFVVIEVIIGFSIHSLSLLADDALITIPIPATMAMVIPGNGSGLKKR